MQTTLDRDPAPVASTDAAQEVGVHVPASATRDDPDVGVPTAVDTLGAVDVHGVAGASVVADDAPSGGAPSEPPVDAPASPELRRRVEAELARALADVRLRNAPQMSAFLRHVVERTLSGEGARVKAYTIGVEALGKHPGFDPQTDPSVRVLAKRVRDALDDHNARAGRQDVRIVLRPGSYRPRFELREAAASGTDADRSAFVERRRSTCPVLHVSSLGTDLAERRLEFVLGGALSRLGTVEVRRGAATAPATRADDRLLCLSLCRVGDRVRLDIDLSDARDGTVLRADVLEFAAGRDEGLGGEAFTALRGWVAAALCDPDRPIGDAARDAEDADRRAALAFGRIA